MEQFLATTLRAAAPLILVALAGVFAFRAGMFHLGLEGLMITGAFTTVAVGHATGSVWLGILAAIAACLVLSFLFWWVIGPLRANIFIAGLGLTSLGLGGTAFALTAIFDTRGTFYTEAVLPRPVSGVNEGWGVILSESSLLVWLAPLFALAAWVVLRRSRFGLRLAAVGEYPFAARSAGVNPSRMRLWALLIAGALCALGGAELSVGALNNFTENMTAGRGFIAFVAVIFGAWHPLGAAAAALFFGLADAIGTQTQINVTEQVPREFVLMIPYVLTIAAVWLGGLLRRRQLEASAGYAELREPDD